MTLKSDKFELKGPAEKSYYSELMDTWAAIDEYEARDLAEHPESAATIRAEYDADRQALRPEIEAQREQLGFENKWLGRYQENPLAVDMVGLLSEAKTDEDVFSFAKALADRFATAEMPGEPVEAEYEPAPIDPNNAAPAAMRRLSPARQREIDAEMAAAMAAIKPQAATHAQPLGELRPPTNDTPRQDQTPYSRSRASLGPVGWDEMQRRAEER